MLITRSRLHGLLVTSLGAVFAFSLLVGERWGTCLSAGSAAQECVSMRSPGIAPGSWPTSESLGDAVALIVAAALLAAVLAYLALLGRAPYSRGAAVLLVIGVFLPALYDADLLPASSALLWVTSPAWGAVALSPVVVSALLLTREGLSPVLAWSPILGAALMNPAVDAGIADLIWVTDLGEMPLGYGVPSAVGALIIALGAAIESITRRPARREMVVPHPVGL